MEVTGENGLAGRPKKFGDEDLAPLNCKVPRSLRAYVDSRKPTLPTDVVIAALRLELALSETLEDEGLLEAVRIYAARNGLSYEANRAEVIVRLVHAGLTCETKKSKK